MFLVRQDPSVRLERLQVPRGLLVPRPDRRDRKARRAQLRDPLAPTVRLDQQVLKDLLDLEQGLPDRRAQREPLGPRVQRVLQPVRRELWVQRDLLEARDRRVSQDRQALEPELQDRRVPLDLRAPRVRQVLRVQPVQQVLDLRVKREPRVPQELRASPALPDRLDLQDRRGLEAVQVPLEQQEPATFWALQGIGALRGQRVEPEGWVQPDTQGRPVHLEQQELQALRVRQRS